MTQTLELTNDPQFGQMLRQVNKLMDQVQKGFFSYCPAETWTPAVNVYENDVGYLVCVDLCGVEKEKIDVTIADGHLKLRGQRNVPIPADVAAALAADDARGPRLRIHTMEIDHGPFCREVEIPQDVSPDKIAARYEHGLLWIELPRK